MSTSDKDRDRFQRLEAQVSELQSILQCVIHPPNHDPWKVFSEYRQHRSLPKTPSEQRIIGTIGQSNPHTEPSAIPSPRSITGVSPSGPSKFSEAQPTPPENVVNHLVQVYREMIHLQPLPLFDFNKLQTLLHSAPSYLLWSFLALTVHFGNHDYYLDNKPEAIRFYTQSAEKVIPSLAFEGVPRLDVQQSLCLLAMKHIQARDPRRAWVAIGTASRLETLQTATQGELHDDRDLISRCHWSIFILERLFFPQLTHGISSSQPFQYPRSAPRPPALSRNVEEIAHLDASATDDFKPDDLGINAYYINSLSVWSDISLYLHKLRIGAVELEQPWLPNSTFTKLSMKVYETESRMSDLHLLRAVHFHKRPPAEIREQQEYWHPWIVMQLIFHAAPALINHPFVHLSATRRARLPQSRHFLQQTVDNALFHSGWVFRLIETCEDLLFDLHDPLIGHVVAATATIAWLFQFAADATVSARATKGFMQCGKLLRRLALLWPHIARKVEIIDSLQTIADAEVPDGQDQNRHVTLPLPELWALLDPDSFEVSQSNQVNSKRGIAASGAGEPRDARIRLSTHFVHPLEENSTGQQLCSDGTSLATNLFTPSQEPFEQLCMDDFFSHLQLDQFQW
ncbi:hypothetical protein E8E14_004340 [Neopestalotiopsis sp. 37M]|nr:hypothetical protein E8E14_004340 [Neopestalotiopsis sp. 37M]